ncbi:MAG: TonB-dependent receptor plug domain-containing protein, partial [Myxococcota bacterium]
MTNTSFRHRWLWGALYGLAGLVASPPAWAQAEEGTSTSTHAIEELTITANLRQQRLQDFAAPAVVISSQDIQDAGIRTTEDFVALVPNLTFDDTFTYLNSFVVLRGVTQINNADPPVAVIVDGVPQNNQKQLKQSLFDIQQVEVVKGPQGSLYGRNAIGGAINIRTRQPTNEFEGVLQLGLENGLGYRAQAGLSGPIVKDLVLFRVSGSFYRTDGLIENTFLGANVDTVDYDYAVRGKLSIRPLDILTVDLRASYNEFDAGSSYDTVVNNEPNGAAVPVFRTGMANDVFAPTSDFRGFTTGRVADLSGKVDLELPFGVATYILGFTDLQEQYR